ncbi:MAG: FAD-dependent oxidoreductase [Thiohalocapsa sp.]|jgi:hypothetical protein
MDFSEPALKGPIERVAVIGAGLSGLTCAASLMLNVPEVRVFEAAPRPGGRTLSHREHGYEFDYGTQYFTVRSGAFRSAVHGWVDERLVAPWTGWVVELDRGDFVSREAMERYVAVPHMGALAVHLAELCDARMACPVERIERIDGESRLYGSVGEDLGSYDLVILAAPPPAVRPLIGALSPTLSSGLAELGMTRCWALMLGFEQRLDVPFDAAHVNGSSIAWAARNNSKPGRGGREAWVVHATPEWSEENAEVSNAEAVGRLSEAFAEALGGLAIRPKLRAARLWSHAAPIEVMDRPFLVDTDAALAACGDWCVAPRLEGAFLSGVALADFIVARL